MNQKLFKTPPDFHSGVCRFLSPKTMIGRLCLIVLLSFISTAGFAQLATQNFDTGIPATWTKAYNGGTSLWTTSTDGYSGSAGAAFVDPSAENIGNGNTARYYLITPQFQAPASGEVRFFTKQSSTTDFGNIYEVRVSTVGPSDLNSFTTVLGTFTEAQLNSTTGYEEKVVSLGAITTGLNIYVAFVLVNQQVGATPNADTWLIDNVSVQTAQVCDPVVATTITVPATSLTPTSATINWTHPTATQFQIIVQEAALPAPAASATGTTVTGAGTSFSYPAGGLTVSTAYKAYIKTICSQSTSAWVTTTANTFSTVAVGSACSYPIIIPATGAPYTFTGNLSNFQNPGVTYANQGSNCLSPAITQNYLNGAKAFFSYTPTQDGLITVTNVTTQNNALNGFNHITGFFVYDGCTNVGVACLGGNNTSTAAVPKTIPNVYVQAGHTYIIVVSSQLTASAGILFTLSVQTAACAPPATFTYKNLLQNSVTFSWDNVGNFASAWEYKVQAAGAGAPTGAGTPTSTNTDVNINTGLVAGTSYDLYVRSVCGGTPGAWSVPYRFATQCTVFPTPYSQNFNAATATVPAPCWTSIDVNNDGLFWSYQSSAANLTTNTFQNLNNDIFAMPQIDLGTTPKRLRYKVQIVNGIAKYAIKLSATGVGGTNFTTTLMPETAFNNNAYLEKIVNIPTSITGPVNIAFVVVPGTGSTATRILIDDVTVEDKPACPDPILPTVSNVTTTTAQLAWTLGDVETQWEVAVQPAGTGVPTANGTLVSSNPYTATVNPSTAYEYYVRAYCSSTQKSNWVGPVAFNTLCTAFNTPFIENFNNGDIVNSHKFCWTIIDVNGGGTFTLGTPTVPVTEAQLVRPGFNAPTSYNDWLITPAINVIGTKELKFKYKSATSIFHPTARNGVEVLMSTTDTNPASFTVISPLLVSTNVDYVEKALYINANGPVYIAFRVPPTYSVAPGTSNLYIDDVRVDEAPACPNPSLLTVSNITVNSAHFAWTKGFLETQWQVAVQPAGTGVPTTGTLVNTNPEFNTVTPLLADTQYEVYVRAYCNGTDQSSWIGPIKFKTLCNPIAAPFIETFNPDSATEQCWLIRNDVGTGTGGGLVYTWNTNAGINPYEGDHAAGIFSGSNGDNNDWLISPTITVTSGQRLRYYYRTNSTDFYEDLEVLLSTTGVESANFTTVLASADYFDVPPLNNTEWKEKVINLPAGVTGNINIAWRIPPKPALSQGYRGQMLLIDKVVIEDIPACSQPANLTVLNITDVQAQLKWDATGTETAWDVYVQPAGLAAPVGDGNPAYFTAVTTNPYTKTGLTAATQYDYYVRAACINSDSPWTGPFSFTTRCSFENLCEYNITLANPINFGDIQGEIRLIQNQVVVQTFNLTTTAGGSSQTFPVFLCDGVEYSLFWDAVGSVPSSGEAQATVTIQKADGTNVWTSPPGVGPMNDVIYTGFAACGVVTCPNPTNLTVTDGVLSWTAGGTETQWEVFVQPLNNGTLPQAGTLVTTNSYTPVAADFTNLANGTYEFFVRAVCSATNKSYWSGPQEFVRNDSAAKAVVVPVNTGDTCEVSSADATFLGATPSTDPMTCTGANNGDIWYQFQATSTAHVIELNNFSGNYYNSSGDPAHPFITMTLYRVNGSVLEEVTCSSVNSITAAYSTATVIGTTYKVRLTLNNNEKTSAAPVANTRAYTFDVCVKTPTDKCSIGIANGGFEDPEAVFGGLTNMFSKQLVPAWRYNIPGNEYFFYMDFSGTAPGGTPMPYEGTQFIQLLTNQTTPNYDPADMVNIEGLYQDIDTSEMTQLSYSYAQAIRASSPTAVQMFMGPPAGPFVLLEDNFSTSKEWTVQTGIYDVPVGQSKTRIMFRTKNPIGSWIVLDAISVVPNNEILTLPHSLACGVDGTSVAARGVGQWIADENNPSDVVIATPNAATTAISGFVLSGDYTFTWKTRYCEETIVINKVANDEIPAVTTPVEYCIDTVATPLTAPELTGYTLAWYDVATGGTALTAAPTPVTTAAGTTPYYVAYVDAVGCEGVRAQIDVVVNDKTNPVVGFAYDAATYCSIGTNPVITLDADFAPNGTFTATPAGLAIDAVTGAIDLSASTAGTYDVTYDVAAVDCINPGTNTVSITVNAVANPVVGFTYTNNVCLNSTAALLPVTATGFATGGTYASATVTVDAVTGEIDLATATAGVHDITYSIAADTSLVGCVNSGTSTFQVTLVQPTVPVTGFTYATAYCIAEANPTPSLDANFYVGGAFSATGGLTIDPVTGEIDMTTATAGTYDITYTVTEEDCLEAGSTTTTVVINALTAPVVAFSYDTPTCINSGNELAPTLADLFNLGGVFSSTTVTVDGATGIIDLTTVTPGNHDILYTLPVDELLCIDGGTFTTTVELKAGINPVTAFTYESSYCYDSTNTLPQTGVDFTTGGTFSSTSGLVINPATGEIDVVNSTPGSYVITYAVAPDAATCNVGGSHTATVSVSGNLDAVITQECRDSNAWLLVAPVNGSFDPETASYVWKNEAGATVSTDAMFNVSEYAAANNTTELPVNFTVTVTSGSCSNEVVYTVLSIMCDIPRGISPNGDGLNDSLDLTGTGINKIEIFNRYGKEVFSYGSGYTNQWHGQDNNNNELPDGTYYYSIKNADGSSKTGWVYINRQY